MRIGRNTCVQILCFLGLMAWSIFGIAQPTNSAPQSADNAAITGEWEGTIAKLRLVLKIEVLKIEQPAGAALRGTLVSLDQGNASIPIDVLSFEPGGALRADMKSIGAVYDGKLSADSTEINGTWQQGGASLPLLFRRPGASAAKSTLKPRTQGRVALEPCLTADGNIEALCGTYDVYENRQSQQGRKIALNIMLLPATTDKPAADPFFAFAGGPGQSATEAYPPAGYVRKVREQRDVVLVDQRGTGKSNLLQCSFKSGSDPQAMIGEAFSLDKIRECRSEMDKKADLTQYTTSIFADDMDEVRQAMGYEKVNVFGGSYGTKSGLVYLRRHGDHVRTLTLEAVATPQYRIPVPFAKTIQTSVDRLIARCAADIACHKDFPDLREEFKTLLDRLEKSPAHFQEKNQAVTLPRDIFVSSLRTLLYFPQFASAFPLMIHNANQGDWTIYGDSVLTLTRGLEGVVARGMSLAAICAEDVPGLTDSFIKRETQGTYLGDTQVRRYQTYCKTWGTVGSIPKDFYAPVRSQVPTLLISGVLDPATPPELAQQAAHDLPNSRLIAIKEGTHGTGSPCIDGLVADFVQQGSAATLDASCADQIHLPPFVSLAQFKQAQEKAGQQ
jgi:pimeloyl-ACP methyl ester carboxylesterase